MTKIALLVIDMQKGCKEDTPCKNEFDTAVLYINEAARIFRERNLPVIMVQDMEVGGGPGSEAFEVVEAIDKSDTDIMVHKKHCNSFWETNLDEILKEKGIEFVVISGFAAEYCVLFTYNGAAERGYEAALLQNGVAGFDLEEIKKIQLLRPVISLGALEYFSR